MGEFEMNLEKAGMGVINPCSSDDMEMVLEEMIENTLLSKLVHK